MKALWRDKILNSVVLKTAVITIAVFLLSPKARATEIFYNEIPPATQGYASWYSVESCKKEGTSGIMANGEVFDDQRLWCASWFYSFGTKLRIISMATGRSIIVTVKDRGPAKRLVKKGRIIDLSKRAFAILAPLSQGLIQVKIEQLAK